MLIIDTNQFAYYILITWAVLLELYLFIICLMIFCTLLEDYIYYNTHNDDIVI